MSFVKAFFKYLDKTIFGMGLLTFWIIWGILTIGVLALIPYGNDNISLIYLFVMLSIFFVKLFDSIFFAGSESFRDFINHFSTKDYKSQDDFPNDARAQTRQAEKEHSKKWDDFPNDAHAQTRQAEKEHSKKWYGIVTSHLSESDDEYALISNKENVFKPPTTPDYSSYEEPLINEERINKFIEWAKNKNKNKNKNKGRLKLLDLIDENLEFEMPELSGNFSLVLKTDGAYFCEDFNVYGFEINRFKSTNPIRLDYEDWVKVLTNPNSFDWLDYIDNIDCYGEDIDYGDLSDLSYFLKDCTEFVPKTGDAIDYFEYAEAFDSYLIDYELVSEISYKDEIFLINEEEFMFSKKEKDHLITLLMASYKPSLLNAIRNQIE